ncbi:FUSC family protein [Synechococcus sp. CS-1328]|uniref:FUSC family protein n=1 Tax=Synechococcus sp. CS-1328 TaxID=2847976 RepID=UPI00223AA366|nr:FUSC family protein [Synechococcus sp. CS-1328]MCT0225660.1 FUSC family protein [Synechococcus sp. CS-1328]
MLIRRDELRLVVTTGLTNALGVLAPLGFGFYATLAVLAVGTGTYGNSLRLGRQRLLGTLLGAAVLVVTKQCLQELPLALALGLALGLMRAMGEWLGLRVGYKVGGLVLVMGWLVHGDDLDWWIPLRLFWTCVGILMALLSLRLFWPSQAVTQTRSQWNVLLGSLAEGLEAAAAQLYLGGATAKPAHAAKPSSAATPTTQSDPQHRRTVELRRQLGLLRRGRPMVEAELGDHPSRHPLLRGFSLLEDACSSLIGALDTLERQPPPLGQVASLTALRLAEAELLEAAAAQLGQWRRIVLQPGESLKPPPPFQAPASWSVADHWLRDPSFATMDLGRLQRIARRLMACQQVLSCLLHCESRWRQLAR